MKQLVLFSLGLLFSLSVSSQILKPVKWSYAAKKTGKTTAILYLKASIEDGWHLYSQNMADGGPIKTTFNFSPAKNYKVTGKTTEPKATVKFEKSFNMNVSYFEKSVIFQQQIKLAEAGTFPAIKGSVEFMVCNDQQCLPPETVNFSVPIK